MGTLFLVATPIGNAEDMTLRALRVLREVSLVAAEDTRHSGRLLKYFDIETRLISFHGHSPSKRIETIVEALDAGDVALITDAGMPAVSDPGAELVRATVEAGHRVEVIPGASAVTAAVAVSGLVDGGFLFAGYPPRRTKDRVLFFTRLAGCGYPIVLFESPHRVHATLTDLESTFPESEIAVCRELTKRFEEVRRGTPNQLRAHFDREAPRGEFVLVVKFGSDAGTDVDQADVDQLARSLLAQGVSASRAAKELATAAGLSRNDAYQRILEIKRIDEDE